MTMDVTSQQMMAQSPNTPEIIDPGTPAQPTGNEDSDGLAKGQGIWENEW